MAKPYSEELVYVESEDGLLLEGVVIRPAGIEAMPVPVVWIHGFTGKFYSLSTVTIGRELAARGFTFVAGNNRGHDVGARLRMRDGRTLLAGGWWERIDESPHDVGAWVRFAAELEGIDGRRPPGIALLGHSLGALKAPYYQAQRQDSRVLGLICASPPMKLRQPDPERLALAERMVAEGRGEDLLPRDPARGGNPISAQTVAARSGDRRDVYGVLSVDPLIAKVRCPIFAFFGSEEPEIGSAPDLEFIRRNATAAPRVQTRMFEGANHSYTGHEAEVAAALAAWVATLG